MPKEVTDLAEFKELINGDKVIAVDFTAVWCGPCKRIGPKFEEFSKEYPNATFIKVDVDAAEEIAAAYKIQAMPTFKFFKGGEMIGEMVGADESKLKALCESHCK
ncbi:uncharacterized protein LOC134857112 [Symsagittifera roscoffensis]|uniref:uncharacterized protein LOC134857112 n=1 Tax=Symsagittifera roscoffensis TaxID=84072 RepID=UPI00307C6476